MGEGKGIEVVFYTRTEGKVEFTTHGSEKNLLKEFNDS